MAAAIESGPAGCSVGLVWAGNPEHSNERRRSMSLAQLLPLLDVEGVQFFALQKGARETEAETMAAGKPLTNLAAELRDLGDTAAVVSQLDLVISVDTSVAHLAGALGKPVWVLLPMRERFPLADGVGRTRRGIRRRGCSGRSAEGTGLR